MSPTGTEDRPPRNVIEALERASLHTRQASVELLAAARAFLDAASIGLSGQPVSGNPALGVLKQALDDFQERLQLAVFFGGEIVRRRFK